MNRAFVSLLLVFGFCMACGLLDWARQVEPDPANLVVIDARTAPPPPARLPFALGGTSPDRHRLSANSRFLLRDGKPWFPIVGEFHYSRYPADRWEEEILKMKAGGIQVISTYIFWIHHEEIEGEFDWSGQRDLRRFVQLCAKHGLYVWIRVGPWAHGEARNGGLPDWLLGKTATRENNPIYLKYVSRFYRQIGEQTNGLFWKDGGPIIGVQLENEYSARGPGKGVAHILRLRQLARDTGLDAPFYTVTGWDGAAIPSHGVLPVFSGYADGFWWRTLGELPPNANYFFTRIRCQENVAEDLSSLHPDIDALDQNYPFLTAEMGGGMEQAYPRRPLVTADDTAAMELVKLGSGVTMYGYYMFHGGTNPEGKKTSLEESQATGYLNDVPLKSYDFQAPLGEFGQANPSFGVLKILHLFLNDFGSELATMTPYFPQRLPSSLHDTVTPRVAARVRGNQAFVFINNYQRNYPLPERKGFQVRLRLPSGDLSIPRRPLVLPSGSYTFWPVNLALGRSVLRYATAQLVSKLAKENTYVFSAEPGIPAEFAFQEGGVETLEAPGARVERSAGIISVEVSPGTGSAMRLSWRDGQAINIVVLSREQVQDLWKLNLGDKERLVLSPSQLYNDGDRLVLLSEKVSELKAGLFPALDDKLDGFSEGVQDGLFQTFVARVDEETLAAKVEKLSEFGDPPVKMGKDTVLMPDETAFAAAAKWKITVPDVKTRNLSEVLLRIRYQGDIARIYAGEKLLTDNFYYGQPWLVGLDRVPAGTPFELEILPLRAQAPIYLPSGARLPIPAGAQVADVKEIEVVPVYRVTVDVPRTTK
jgi:hypothetical protein